MYQTHEPHQPNHLVGVATAIVVTALAAIGISSGLARDIIIPPEPTTVVAVLDAPANPVEPTEVLVPEIDEIQFVPDRRAVEVVIPEIDFVIPSELPTAITPEPVSPATPATSGSVGSPPKLIIDREPRYPAASIRAEEEGTTTLSVCVSERGRVQSAQLAASSGHARLDQAALDWMKKARFRPARLDGKTRAVCGHTVAYEWNLERAR